MSLPYGAGIFTDADFTHAAPVSMPAFEPPLPNTTASYVFKQKFRINQNNFAPLPLNTEHPDYPTYVLVNESPQQDMRDGSVEWTRTYAAIPATYSEYETFSASFIGVTFSSAANPATTWPTVFTRSPFSRRVQSRVQYDFFLTSDSLKASAAPNPYDGGGGVDHAGSPTGAGTVASPYDIPGSIPFIFGMLYLAQAFLRPSGGPPTIWYGGLGWTASFLSPTTMPTQGMYNAMMIDAAKNGWNATLTQQFLSQINPAQWILNPPATAPPDDPSPPPGMPNTPTPNSVYGGQMPAEDSQLSRWQGNIWVRKTRYILAQ